MKGNLAARMLMAGILALSLGMVACKKKPPVTDPTDEPKPAELTVYTVKPNEGVTDKATAVTIVGAGFKDGAKAFIGDTAITDMQRESETTIRGNVPAGLSTGTFNVIVRNPDGKEGILQRGFKVLAPKNDTPTEKPVECTVSPVYFDFDMSSLSDDARGVLQEDATCIKNKKMTAVSVEGHTDERGSTDYNLALGQRRADEVKRYLSTLGVNNINTVSYGEERPAVQGSDEDSWSKNRRVELNSSK